MAYSCVRTDLMTGTDNRAALVSFKYQNASAVATEIENGHVVKLGGLKDGEREVFVAKDVASDTSLTDLVLVAGVEVDADERKRNLEDWINPTTKPTRGYRIKTGQIFSVTADALTNRKAESAAMAKGDVVYVIAGNKLAVGGTGGTAIGKLLDIEVSGRYTWHVISVD